MLWHTEQYTYGFYFCEKAGKVPRRYMNPIQNWRFIQYHQFGPDCNHPSERRDKGRCLSQTKMQLCSTDRKSCEMTRWTVTNKWDLFTIMIWLPTGEITLIYVTNTTKGVTKLCTGLPPFYICLVGIPAELICPDIRSIWSQRTYAPSIGALSILDQKPYNDQ